jgi:hypothetical protein
MHTFTSTLYTTVPVCAWACVSVLTNLAVIADQSESGVDGILRCRHAHVLADQCPHMHDMYSYKERGTRTHTHTHSLTHSHARTRTHTHTRARARERAHTHTYSHTHACTRTRTRTRSRTPAGENRV